MSMFNRSIARQTRKIMATRTRSPGEGWTVLADDTVLVLLVSTRAEACLSDNGGRMVMTTVTSKSGSAMGWRQQAKLFAIQHTYSSYLFLHRIHRHRHSRSSDTDKSRPYRSARVRG